MYIVNLKTISPDGNGSVSSTAEINDSTSNGPTLTDEDRFGTSVANIGDLDNDGVDDIVVGARADDNNSLTDNGAVHIMFLNTDGSVDSTVEINDVTANGPVLSNGDRFGISVANIGDLNKDGVNDIAVGALDDNGGTDRGAIHIMFMDTDGSIDSATVEINSASSPGPSIIDGDFFGASITNIGDLDNDGVDDLAVGALNYYDSRLEPFSSQGPTNHCVQAPSVMGPDAVATLAYDKKPFYGTSAAAPHVAGIVALMLDKTPQLTPLQILSELVQNSNTEFSSYENLNNVFGFGAADSEFIAELDEIVTPIELDDGCMLSKSQTSERYGDSDQQSKFAVAGVITQQGIDAPVIPIPEWVKKNAGWWSDGTMNDDTFTNAIEFLIEKQILDIPMKENISEVPKDKEKHEFEEIVEVIPIPDWIKNNAGWWSDGTINDDAFVSAIQYLVEQGIIDV